MSQYSSLETYLETEEFVTADEFLRRRERGEVNPADVRIAPPDFQRGTFGGFYVKLKNPRYQVKIEGIMDGGGSNALY